MSVLYHCEFQVGKRFKSFDAGPLVSIILESDSDGEEQMNMETFLKRKDLKGHWEATGVQNKKYILVLSSSQLIIMQPASDGKWAKIKSRR